MAFRSRSRRRFAWREFATTEPLDRNVIGIQDDTPFVYYGQQGYAIYGDTFDESAFGTLPDIAAATRAIDEGINRRKRVERIVGTMSFRAYRDPDIAADAPGATPEYICRVGFIVLESDGKRSVPLVKLDGGLAADTEANWLHVDQFSIVGAHLFTDNQGTNPPNADGMNHYLVDRRYDIRVGRVLEPHDLLVMIVSIQFGIGGPYVQEGQEYNALEWKAWMRMLCD